MELIEFICITLITVIIIFILIYFFILKIDKSRSKYENKIEILNYKIDFIEEEYKIKKRYNSYESYLKAKLKTLEDDLNENRNLYKRFKNSNANPIITTNISLEIDKIKEILKISSPDSIKNEKVKSF